MSALLLCGRRWYIDASDTLVPALCNAFIVFPLMTTLIVYYIINHDSLPCSGERVSSVLLGTAGLAFLTVFLDICVIVGSYRAKIFRQSPLVVCSLYLKAALFFADVVSATFH